MKIRYKICEWGVSGITDLCARIIIKADDFYGEYYINKNNINSCLGCYMTVNYRRFGKKSII